MTARGNRSVGAGVSAAGRGSCKLEATSVTRIYGGGRMVRGRGGVTAVAGVDLEVEHGFRLGIVGESGSGKSTLGRLLAGLEPPTEGTIRWNGTAIDELDRVARRQYRRSVQMVFQDPFTAFNPRRRIIASFLDVMRSWGASDNEAMRARATELAERVGLDAAHLDRYPHQLSGGQRQRLVIARCLAVDPQVLIADEPVAALDVSVQAQVLNLFQELVTDLGLGLVFISHDLRAVGFIAERTAVMYRGEIVETGRTAELMRAPSHPHTAALLEGAFGEAQPAAAAGGSDQPAPRASPAVGHEVER